MLLTDTRNREEVSMLEFLTSFFPIGIIAYAEIFFNILLI